MAHSYILNKTVEEYINSRTDKSLQPSTPKRKNNSVRNPSLLCCVRFFTGQEGLGESVSSLRPSVTQDVLNKED